MDRMSSPRATAAAATEPASAGAKNGAIIRYPELLLAGWLGLFLLWAPCPFGGVTPWAAALLQVLAFVTLALAAWVMEKPRDLRSALLPAGALAAVALLGLAQSLPWPATLAGLVSPGHADVWRQA